MRLIDADALKEKLFIADDNFNPVVTENEIDLMATAYDVEKVIEQLGELREDAYTDDSEWYVDEAMHIVRKGGVGYAATEKECS